ncbi:MAG TPA: hypothetical protein VK991_02330 [Halomonas sp.]|nr:hypothetical protein [Halomonas sp.]
MLRPSPPNKTPRRERGLALVAVLWITAALAALALSLSQMTRTDTRVVQVHKQTTEARALGDGAIAVAAAWLWNHGPSLVALERREVTVGQTPVSVEIVPVTGLIDINHAEAELLELLFRIGANLPPAEARQLAERVIAWRSPPDGELAASGDDSDFRHAPFYTVDDLRQVPGITPDIYASVSRLLVAHWSVYQIMVDPASAPLAVLEVLADGDHQLASQLALARDEARDEGQARVDFSALSAEQIGQGAGTSVFRLDAVVTFENGRRYRRTAWVNTSPRGGQGQGGAGATPWHIWQVESLRSMPRD